MTKRRENGIPSVPAALRELDAQQTHFVTELLELGGGPQHGPQAALTAGYAVDYEDAARAARILLRSPKILVAIKDGVTRRFEVAIASAVKTLIDIVEDTNAPANARISAAQEILNRSSIGPVISKNAKLEVRTSIEDLWAALDAREARTKSSATVTVIETEATAITEEAETDE